MNTRRARSSLVGWLALGIAVLFSGAVAQEDAAPRPLGAVPVSCPMGVTLTEIEGETIVCGQISVPQNWADPDGVILTITYAVLRSTSSAPFTDPILYFEGGPGGSALSVAGQKANDFALLRATRDVILWDQRGTTYSGDLFCPDDVQITDAASAEEAQARAEAAFGAAQFSVDSDPDEIYAFLRDVTRLADRGRCLPFFDAQGIDLEQYSTSSTVLDALALMHHLDRPAYNLYGISYGTTVTLAILDYLHRHDDAGLPEVRSAVVDGVFPLKLEWAENSLITGYNVLRTFADCEADRDCVEAYPEARERAIALLDRLEATPTELDDGTVVTLNDLVEVLRSGLTSHPELLPFLPRVVAEVEEGAFETFLLAQSVARSEATLVSSTAAVASETVRSMADEATNIAEGLREAADRVRLLGVSSDILDETRIEADSRPGVFVGILARYFELVSIARGLVAPTLETYRLFPERRTREALAGLKDAVFLPGLARELEVLSQRMTDEEVGETFRRLTSPRFMIELVKIESTTNRAVDCNDRARTFFGDEAFEVIRAFEAPQLADRLWEVANYQIGCEQLGLDAPYYVPASAVPAVHSDVRTLVMNGSVDGATPVEWGEIAFETLSDAVMVTIPGAGHGASVMTECGRDLTNAFFLAPGHPLNLKCVDALRPDFVLPTEPLPGVND